MLLPAGVELTTLQRQHSKPTSRDQSSRQLTLPRHRCIYIVADSLVRCQCRGIVSINLAWFLMLQTWSTGWLSWDDEKKRTVLISSSDFIANIHIAEWISFREKKTKTIRIKKLKARPAIIYTFFILKYMVFRKK